MRNDDLMTQSQYATRKGVSHSAVAKWIQTGKLGTLGDALIQKGKRVLIDPSKADALLQMNLKLTNQGLPLDATGGNDPINKQTAPDYRASTAWKARAEALVKLFEYDILSGKYILADEARTTFFNIARTFRDALLNIPPRISAILAAESYEAISPLITETQDNPSAILETLKARLSEKTELILSKEIKAALEELSKIPDIGRRGAKGKRPKEA